MQHFQWSCCLIIKPPIMKVIKYVSAFLLLLTMFATVSQAQTNRNFPINSIKSVSVSSGIDLYLTHGNTEALNIKSDASTLKDIEVINNNGSLTIRFKNSFKWSRILSSKGIKAYLNYKNLSSISASGGSDVYTQNVLQTTNLSLKASGGSDLSLSISCKNLSLQISGGSDADLSGKAENMTAELSGGSDLNAYKFLVSNAKVNASGGSDAKLSVSQGLDANATGGSDIYFKGNPAVRKNDSKSGSVKRVN